MIVIKTIHKKVNWKFHIFFLFLQYCEMKRRQSRSKKLNEHLFDQILC